MHRNTKELKPHQINEKLYGDEPLPELFLESIKAKGILVPLAVKQDGLIISGHRRWRAAQAVGLEAVPVEIVVYEDDLTEREAVIDYNRQREKTLSQKMREAEELEAIERERARERQAHGQTAPGKNASGNVSVSVKGETRDRVAAAIGFGSGRTYEKAKTVWETAKQGNPVAQELVEKLDQGATTVNRAYLQIRREALTPERPTPAEPPPVPSGTYNVIYADPPWQYDNKIYGNGPAEDHYGTMTVDRVASLLEDQDIDVAPNAVLFLWATNPLLPEAFRVIEAWGFEYKTNAVWVKTDLKKPGLGWYVRGRHELLLIATRGSFTPLDPHLSPPIGSVIEAPVREHSRKPEEAYTIMERLYPGCAYLELFARHARLGWDGWGLEL